MGVEGVSYELQVRGGGHQGAPCQHARCFVDTQGRSCIVWLGSVPVERCAAEPNPLPRQALWAGRRRCSMAAITGSLQRLPAWPLKPSQSDATSRASRHRPAACRRFTALSSRWPLLGRARQTAPPTTPTTRSASVSSASSTSAIPPCYPAATCEGLGLVTAHHGARVSAHRCLRDRAHVFGAHACVAPGGD